MKRFFVGIKKEDNKRDKRKTEREREITNPSEVGKDKTNNKTKPHLTGTNNKKSRREGGGKTERRARPRTRTSIPKNE